MKTLEDIQEALDVALQSDLEHGVAWLNDNAWMDFNNDYPMLSDAIGKIMDMEGELCTTYCSKTTTGNGI